MAVSKQSFAPCILSVGPSSGGPAERGECHEHLRKDQGRDFRSQGRRQPGADRHRASSFRAADRPGPAFTAAANAAGRCRTSAQPDRERQGEPRPQLQDVDRRPVEAARHGFQPGQPQGAGDRAGLYRTQGRQRGNEYLAAQGSDEPACRAWREGARLADGLSRKKRQAAELGSAACFISRIAERTA